VSAAAIAVAGAAWFPVTAQAAQPTISAIWVTEVSAASATFHAEIDPEGEATTYRFEYATDQAFQEKGFTGAAKAPAGGSASAGSGTSVILVSQHVSALRANTLYHYRLTASNGGGPSEAGPRAFATQETGAAFSLPDGRGWELVSPAEKNGGSIQGPGGNHRGGVLQAAAGGPGEITYSSASSFGGYGALGAPPASQYLSRRGGTGWATENITAPTVSGSYGNEPNGVPYQLFSPDLARGVMLNGVHCRGEGTKCPVANPPLPGSGADTLSGYQNYYLRDNESGSFTALLSSEHEFEIALGPSELNLAFAGSSPDLRHPILSTCAKLILHATEIAGPEGCDPNDQNLYEWNNGLALINRIGGEPTGQPFASLAAPGGAVSEDGSRVYWTMAGGLYLYERSQESSYRVDQFAGAGTAQFQTASPDGSVAFFIKGEHLFRYQPPGGAATDLTPSGGVLGVLGASEDGSRLYYVTATGVYLWQSGTTTPVASGPAAADPADYPPATGAARVSADGNRLLFLSKESLTGYDNHDQASGQPDPEVFLYEAGSGAGGTLRCLSCNPTGERPLGPSTIAGAYANGAVEAAAPGEIVTDAYKPRNLAASANRVFFDSGDALAALDTNKASDVYQWEAQGTGSCAKAAGCVALISSGSDGEGAGFVDASESGEDAYFLTSASLVVGDPGSRDVYDARVGGGFPVPPTPIPCEGDACAPLPSPPEDPTVGTLIPGTGNPPIHFPKVKKCPKSKREVIKKGKVRCVAKHHGKGRHGKRARRSIVRSWGGGR
jgi:hypothetical protein